MDWLIDDTAEHGGATTRAEADERSVHTFNAEDPSRDR